jgi:hypothetical protein
VVEDLFTIVVLVLLPALFGGAGGGPGSLPLALLLAALKIGALIALTFLLGGRLIPWLLGRVAATRSRELFTLTVLVVALGIAVGSAKLFGVSMALGAFLAGMVVLVSSSPRSGESAGRRPTLGSIPMSLNEEACTRNVHDRPASSRGKRRQDRPAGRKRPTSIVSRRSSSAGPLRCPEERGGLRGAPSRTPPESCGPHQGASTGRGVPFPSRRRPPFRTLAAPTCKAAKLGPSWLGLGPSGRPIQPGCTRHCLTNGKIGPTAELELADRLGKHRGF